jgi:hypothetical protein
MLIKLFEEYNTGLFKVDDMYFTLHVEDYTPTQVFLMLGDDFYDELSVLLPESSTLKVDEFFLNPEIDEKIVKVLLEQNFISEIGTEVMAGDNPTKSYVLV